MNRAHRVLIGKIGQEHAGAHDIFGAAAEIFDGTDDQFAAARGLRRGAAGRGGAVILDRAGASNDDAIADAHRPAEPESLFVG